MKLVATLLIAAVIGLGFASNVESKVKGSECCGTGAACCYPGSPCCE